MFSVSGEQMLRWQNEDRLRSLMGAYRRIVPFDILISESGLDAEMVHVSMLPDDFLVYALNLAKRIPADWDGIFGFRDQEYNAFTGEWLGDENSVVAICNTAQPDFESRLRSMCKDARRGLL